LSIDDTEKQAMPKIAGKRELTKVNNRKSILKAARQTFAELGYGATTVRDIIRRTELASGTFYNYFQSKEEVFQALMDANALEIRPRLRETRAQAETFEDLVEGTFRTFFEYLGRDREAFEVMRSNTGAIRVRMDTPEIVAGFDELQDDIEKAIQDGMLRGVDAGYLTAAAVGVAFEVGDRMLKRKKTDVDGAVKFATALFIGGVSSLPTV
jgi:AcrR family transcriptional regulator